MPHRLLRHLTGKNRSRNADIALGTMLAFIAGAVNVMGFMAVGRYTSHMTGIVSSIADYLMRHQQEAALQSLGLVVAFIGGAAISAMVIRWGKAHDRHSQYAMALLLEAVLLTALALFPPQGGFYDAMLLLCFIMGLQNAIITKISNAEIRTTHVTGLCTDIGIELGRYLTSFHDAQYNPAVQKYKLRLHGGLLVSFLLGGIVGAFAFRQFAFMAILPLALLLAVTASVPIVDDLRKK